MMAGVRREVAHSALIQRPLALVIRRTHQCPARVEREDNTDASLEEGVTDAAGAAGV